jgi:putative ABC transport system substrate-binding protein
MSFVRRRTFLLVLGAGLIATHKAIAQQPKVWRIGILSGRARPASIDSDVYGSFLRGMRDLGYVEGKNVRYEWRFAEDRYERLPDLAAELVRLNVDLIVAATTPPSLAAQKATATIPIVVVSVGNPVGNKLVASLARPGANITGVTNFVGDTSDKLLELTLSALPGLSKVGVLMNPDNPLSRASSLKPIEAASQKRGITVLVGQARTLEEVDREFSAMKQKGAGAVIVAGDTFYYGRREQIAQAALKVRLPSIYSQRQHAEAGGLMSYGASLDEVFHRAAFYVDRIFKGTKPADLPVEQPNTLELVVNLKAASALGITIPPQLLARADKVIQ